MKKVAPAGPGAGGGGDPCIALLSNRLEMDFLVPALRDEFPGADLRTQDSLGRLDDIDVAVCWYPPAGLLAQLPRLQLIQSIGAGVDHILTDPSLPRLPVCRIVDDDMAQAMVAYVTWAVIHGQRHMGSYLESARIAAWHEEPIVPPSRHRVGVAGSGLLGMACARVLATMGYRVRGWSRRPKPVPAFAFESFVGDAGRAAFLAGCDTLICLLPLTPATRGILDASLFAALPRGAHVINVGRGALLNERDLLAAISDGRVGKATLDTFELEPLPASHPFWAHPDIVVTPHIASRTHPSAIARRLRANLDQLRSGGAMPGCDAELGY